MDTKLFFGLLFVSTLIVVISAKPAENTLHHWNSGIETLQIDNEQNVSVAIFV